MINIGIISDTHGVLRDMFAEELKHCDAVIHAGDIGSERCYQRLKEPGVPVYMVRGNSDHGSWASYLPEKLSFSIGGHLFYLIHDRNQMPFTLPETEYVIFGHTHCYEMETKRGITYLNPGSASNSRGGGAVSIAILSIAEDTVTVRRVTP